VGEGPAICHEEFLSRSIKGTFLCGERPETHLLSGSPRVTWGGKKRTHRWAQRKAFGGGKKAVYSRNKDLYPTENDFHFLSRKKLENNRKSVGNTNVARKKGKTPNTRGKRAYSAGGGAAEADRQKGRVGGEKTPPPPPGPGRKPKWSGPGKNQRGPLEKKGTEKKETVPHQS